MSELLTDKKYILKLQDKEYELSPLSWGMIADIETEFDCSMPDILPLLQKTPFKTTLKLASVFLKQHDISKETIESLTKSKDIKVISDVIGEIIIDFLKE